jgi:hypothetical protein
MAQHARHAIAQVQRIASEEIHEVRDLQREDVAGVIDEHAVERFGAAMPVALREAARGGGQRLLARRRPGERRLRGIQHGERIGAEAALEEGHQQQGLGGMGAGEIGSDREGFVERRQRIAAERASRVEGSFVGLQRAGVGNGERKAAGIFQHGQISVEMRSELYIPFGMLQVCDPI